MNTKLTKAAREVIGQFLKEMRESKNISKYYITSTQDLRIEIINSIESGQSNYTMDSFLKYTTAIGAYIFFGDKEGKDETNPLDTDHILKEQLKNNPKK